MHDWFLLPEVFFLSRYPLSFNSGNQVNPDILINDGSTRNDGRSEMRPFPEHEPRLHEEKFNSDAYNWDKY
jgi:hypothetical protein